MLYSDKEIDKVSAGTGLWCWETRESHLIASCYLPLQHLCLFKDGVIALKHYPLEGQQQAILSCIHWKYLSKKEKFLNLIFLISAYTWKKIFNDQTTAVTI